MEPSVHANVFHVNIHRTMAGRVMLNVAGNAQSVAWKSKHKENCTVYNIKVIANADVSHDVELRQLIV